MGVFIRKILNLPEIIFIVFSLIFGLLCMFITPYNEVPDENGHLMRAAQTEAGILTAFNHPKKTDNEKLIEKFTKDNRDDNITQLVEAYSAVMYIPASLGIKLGAYLYNDGKIMFYFGRFFNLLSYIVLVSIAIKITPVFKYPFMISALLPMSLYLAPSYSADSFNNAFAFLFFAYIFKLIFTSPMERKITKRHYIILFIFSIIGAFCKGLVYPVFLFLFLPDLKMKKIFNIILKSSLIIIPIVVCYLWNKSCPLICCPDIETFYDKGIIFHAPVLVLKKIIGTTGYFFRTYLDSMIGCFGNYTTFPLSKALYNTSIIMFISMFIFLPEKVNIKHKLTALFLVILFYLTMMYKLLITWTEMESIYIEGMQGRYFISTLPLVFLILSCNRIKINDKIKDIYRFLLTSFFVFINVNVVLYLYVFYCIYNLKTGF